MPITVQVHCENCGKLLGIRTNVNALFSTRKKGWCPKPCKPKDTPKPPSDVTAQK